MSMSGMVGKVPTITGGMDDGNVAMVFVLLCLYGSNLLCCYDMGKLFQLQVRLI